MISIPSAIARVKESLDEESRYGVYPYLIVGLVALIIAPWVLPVTYTRWLTEILILGLFAMAYDYMYGYTGMVSFGHAAPWAIGAYSVALPIWHFGFDFLPVLLGIGFVLALVWGVIVGYITIRTTGVYFAILTLAFAQMLFIAVQHMTTVTGGDDGVPYTLPDIFGLSLYDRTVFYYLAVTIVLACMYVLYRMVKSPLGATLKGIRENRERMQYLGYNERKYRIIAFTVSCGFSGIAGALMGISVSFAHPEFAFFVVSGEVIVFTIIGGAGTLFGPVLGAGLFYLAEEIAAGIISWWLIPVGILFIAVMIFMPEGIWGKGRELLNLE